MPDNKVATSQKRLRVCTTKVKSGCITCKIRRVKCDEQKPACARCLDTGRKCDGYKVPNTLATSKLIRPPRATIVQSLSFPPLGNERERRSFHYFCNRTALTGYYESNFWNRLVPQVAHAEPTIKHAVMALGSLHEKYEASCPSFLVNQEANSAQQFALMQCNKAISHLSKRLRMNEEDSMEIALIACVLFITFEQLQGNYESALRHWQQGKKVLHGWQEAKNNYQSSSSNALIPLCNPDVIEDNLIRFFGRLDVQAITFIDTRSLQCDETWQSKKPGLGPPHIPDKISSLSEARHYLDEQLEWMFYAAARAIFRLDAWPGDGENTNNVAGLHGYDGLDRWAARFDAFLKHSGSALSARDIRGATLLKILHKVASIMLLSTGLEGFVADETCFDKFSIEFVDILSLAASLINAEISDGVTEAKQARPSFSFDMGVVPPLYYIAVKCREPSIRRQALSLLLASPRREGVWDGLMAARITERLIAIEEEGLESITDCASIPGSARITLVNASMYSDQRRAFLEYTQPRYSTDGNLDTREMWVSW